jgi:hypothetical protein
MELHREITDVHEHITNMMLHSAGLIGHYAGRQEQMRETMASAPTSSGTTLEVFKLLWFELLRTKNVTLMVRHEDGHTVSENLLITGLKVADKGM